MFPGMMGWTCQKTVKRNAHSHPKATDAEAEILRRLLKYDILLYEEALELHGSQLRAYKARTDSRGCR